MAQLSPNEREALRSFSKKPPLQQPPLQPMKMEDFLRTLSQLPTSLRPIKPISFRGNSWKL
jgi:hypothetical protein